MTTFDVIVVGAGPAGISAAVYAKRYNLNVMVMERNYIPGGKILYPHWIENYIGFPNGISGADLGDLFSRHLNNMEITIENSTCQSIKKSEEGFVIQNEKKESFSAKTVVLTQGTEERKLGIPGEEKFKGLGVSYCATCDAPFFKGKTIATIGGGDSALSETLYLSEFAEKLYLIHRRDSLRGAEFLGNKINNNPKIIPYFGYIPTEISGDQFVKQIEIQEISTMDKKNLLVDGVFIFAGYEPYTKFVEEKITLDEKGFIITNDSMETNIPGLLAAGDIRSKPLRQIITAVSDGAIAAYTIREILKG
jgi:thioredoxin reductase (NADPH)